MRVMFREILFSLLITGGLSNLHTFPGGPEREFTSLCDDNQPRFQSALNPGQTSQEIIITRVGETGLRFTVESSNIGVGTYYRTARHGSLVVSSVLFEFNDSETRLTIQFNDANAPGDEKVVIKAKLYTWPREEEIWYEAYQDAVILLIPGVPLTLQRIVALKRKNSPFEKRTVMYLNWIETMVNDPLPRQSKESDALYISKPFVMFEDVLVELLALKNSMEA